MTDEELKAIKEKYKNGVPQKEVEALADKITNAILEYKINFDEDELDYTIENIFE